jgi:PP-loop superfamily ATP-utilizing enzyme
MNSSHGEVRRWLESVLGKDNIPDYQINKESLEKLNQLRQLNRELTDREARIREQKEREIREVNGETMRIKGVMQRAGEDEMAPIHLFEQLYI